MMFDNRIKTILWPSIETLNDEGHLFSQKMKSIEKNRV